jgi:hypothetical protein
MNFTMKKSFTSVIYPVLCGLCVFILLQGCSSATKTVKLKIHSEPEGAYIVYKVKGAEIPCAGEWIYLGNTPFRGIHQFSEDQLEDADKITLKVMRQGYTDQIIEWSGPAFWEEAETKGVIFWTPELIPESQN